MGIHDKNMCNKNVAKGPIKYSKHFIQKNNMRIDAVKPRVSNDEVETLNSTNAQMHK